MTEKPPEDPADHAEDFAHRWVDRLEIAVEGRMHALNIPEDQIGSSDYEHGVPWRTFFPHERDGGGNSPGGRINVDSGVLNPRWHDEVIGPQAQSVWEKARLRDRIDSAIAHEFEEAEAGGSHDLAVENAPDTALPIGEKVRELLRAIRAGEQQHRSTHGGDPIPLP